MSNLELFGYSALALIAISSLCCGILLRQSSRYWDKYPNSLKEMQELDNELCRREGRL